ncbi:MAG TPA: 50S ribosomal protein L15 [Thermomicrobiales bacterium]|nr:50S ribosomal protein L15 [Thermomicrobiales bacterium]
MKLDDLRAPEGAFRPRKRVGRGHGSGHVKTSGRGTKGQNSRSGGGVRPGFEGGQNPIYRRMPYKRGFKNPFRVECEIVNLERLAELGLEGTITPQTLYERGAISRLNRPLKILGDGKLSGAIHVQAHRFSASAREKIEAAGGIAEVIE